MTTLTLNLDDATYKTLQAHARRTGRTESQVVADVLKELPPQAAPVSEPIAQHSYRDFKPLGLHFRSEDSLAFDDLLGEMIDDDDRD